MEDLGRFNRVLVFVWMMSHLRMDCLMTDPSDCQFIKDSYVCGDIPGHIPSNITDVVVTAFQGVSFANKFKNSTWGRVNRLDLTGPQVDKISNNVFATLCNLTTLTLKLPLVTELKSKAFAKLDHVKRLEMVDMGELQSPLFSALTETLPELEEFTFNPGTTDLPPTVQLSTHTAEKVFADRRMKTVNISKAFIGTTVMAMMRTALSDVETFNISGSTLMFFDFERFGYWNDMMLNKLNTGKPIFKTLDISRSRYSNGPFQQEIQSILNLGDSKKTFHKYMMLIENLFADGIFDEDEDFVLSYNYTGYPVFWKRISVRGNNLRSVTGKFKLDVDNTLHSVDFSDNKIAFVSPESWSSLFHLKMLNLSSNRLYKMQNTDEFQSLFKIQRELRMLDLSFNNLSFIPFYMFDANDNLEYLNLGSNRLSTIMFRLTELRKLKYLDLSGNQIQLMDGEYFSNLRQYIAVMRRNHTAIIMNLNGNPLLCACKSADFIEWLAHFSMSSGSKNVYYCNYEGETQKVDQSAVDKSKYLCKREIIIIVSVSVSSGLCVCMLVGACGFIKLRRMRKQISRAYQFRKEFNGQNTAGKFIMFMAYASLEERLVRNHLLSPLNQTLKLRLGISRDLIATGYSFRPGFRITEETFRLIKLSYVVLAVVSNHFCRSEYCIAELHEACNQRKPIILVFIGEVDESDMSPYLREVFKRVVRAKMVLSGNGAVEIVPSVENICESVILLSMKEASVA